MFARTAYLIGGVATRRINDNAVEAGQVNFAGFRGAGGICVASTGIATAGQTTFLLLPGETTIVTNPGPLFVPPLRRVVN